MCVSTSYIYKGKVKDPRYMQNKKDHEFLYVKGYKKLKLEHNYVCCFIEKDLFFLPIFQMIQTAYDDARIPKHAYDILLGLYIPVMILGATLNLFLLCTIFSTKKLRTEPRNAFILALAVSDFFLCNFTCPLTLYMSAEGHWPLGKESFRSCNV